MESDELALQRRLAASLSLPPEFAPVLAAAQAIHLLTTAVGLERQSAFGLGLLVGGLAVFALAAGWLLARFRSLNGATVGGLTSKAVFGTSPAGSFVYVAAFVATTWAAFAGAVWLAVLFALAGGVAYAAAALTWWRTYQHDPGTHAHGESRFVLSLMALVAMIGAIVLVSYR